MTFQKKTMYLSGRRFPARHRPYFALVLWLMQWAIASSTAALERFPYQSSDTLTLYVGKVETLRYPDIERVAVGRDKLLSTSILSSGELLLIPQAPGTTELVVWQAGNRKRLLSLQIRENDPQQIMREARARLARYEQLRLDVRNGRVIVRGEVSTAQQLEDIRGALGAELLDQLSLQIEVMSGRIVQTALAHIDGLNVRLEDGWVSLSGTYPPEHQSAIEQLGARYPNLINTARPDPARLKPMVLVDVQIVEIRHRDLEKLGVRWDSSIAGPAAGLATAAQANPWFRSTSPLAEAVTANLPTNDTHTYGSVGLATNIGSRIELMQESGKAKMLARPMLSTRDGTPSNFHSGGEIPFPVIDARTGNVAVDFHSYGVSLTILPRVSDQKTLLVEIEAEVSSIDTAISIAGVPGLVSKSVRSVVNAREGETIVLSGLLSREQDSAQAQVPVLGSIPVLGRLFSATHVEENDRELAIFLTPRLHHPLLAAGESSAPPVRYDIPDPASGTESEPAASADHNKGARAAEDSATRSVPVPVDPGPTSFSKDSTTVSPRSREESSTAADQAVMGLALPPSDPIMEQSEQATQREPTRLPLAEADPLNRLGHSLRSDRQVEDWLEQALED